MARLGAVHALANERVLPPSAAERVEVSGIRCLFAGIILGSIVATATATLYHNAHWVSHSGHRFRSVVGTLGPDNEGSVLSLRRRATAHRMMTGSFNNRSQTLGGWEIASDLVIAIAVVWALPLSLALVTGLLRLVRNAM
jgi:hypothetical protein